MDELSTLGETHVSRAEAGGAVTHGRVAPEDAGLDRAPDLEGLRGGTPEENARTLAAILAGEITGARRDLVLLNAAAGFVVAGLADDLVAGVERARASIGQRPGRNGLLERLRQPA